MSLLQAVVVGVSVLINSVLLILGICRVRKESNPNVIRYAVWFYWAGLVCSLGICAIAVLCAFTAAEDEAWLSLFFLAADSMCVLLCVMAHLYRIEIDGEYINYRGEFGAKGRYAIKDIYIKGYTRYGVKLQCGKKRIPLEYAKNRERLLELVAENPMSITSKESKAKSNVITIAKSEFWASLVLLAGAIGGVMVLIFSEGLELPEQLMLCILSMLFGAIGIFGFLQAKNFRIEIEGEHINYTTSFGNVYKLHIDEIKITGKISVLLILTCNGKKFYLNSEAKNVEVLLEKLAANSEEEND
ncbi:MAG: hypothetical protein LBS74_04750 [Oscillospiraceae bacterium]|jgi:hypothetical protein|nr:hypothetical protein [Oscillospiraceae bacterium]